MSWFQRWVVNRRWASPNHAQLSDPLVLWCDYGPADPTWRFVDGGPRVTQVPMDSLALTEETKDALRAWHRLFEEIWSPDVEPTVAEWDRFITEGERLRDMVAAELGPDEGVVLDHGR
jgi:hypothetical protein